METIETREEAQRRLLTAEKLAVNLVGRKTGKSTIYRMAAKGLIPYVLWGPNLGAIRFEEEKVRAALAQLGEQRKVK